MRVLFPLLASAALLSACSRDGDGNQASAGNTAAESGGEGNASAAAGRTTIAEAIGQNQDLSQLGQAVQAAGLGDVLRRGSYTLFAPNNAAFDALPAEAKSRLMSQEGREDLRQLLSGHLVVGVVTAEDLGRAIERGQGRATLATVGGGTLTVQRDGDALVVTDAAGGRARITQPDQIHTNGASHVIDAVLMPAAAP